MNTRELMIGNWVRRKSSGSYQQIKEVLSSMVLLQNEPPLNIHKHMTIPIRSIEPIPLTPEILENCGFDISEPTHIYKYPLLLSYITTDENYEFEFKHPFLKSSIIEIKSLHQLQNLWFSLTNKELEINL